MSNNRIPISSSLKENNKHLRINLIRKKKKENRELAGIVIKKRSHGSLCVRERERKKKSDAHVILIYYPIKFYTSRLIVSFSLYYILSLLLLQHLKLYRL